jgi:hypothetical protein
MKATFKTAVTQEEGMNATGLPIPAEAVVTLDSGKRPKVKVSFNGYSYRSTVAAYGDVFMLPLSKEHRDAAGVKAGDQVEVTLELDTEPRIVEVPDELAMALAEGGLTAVFDALAPSKRKEHVRQVTSAKAESTRQRRIAKIVTTLSES